MQILCEVNQAEAFRRGIDAPRSTIKVEVNPVNLPEDIRVFIADNLTDGYKFGVDTFGEFELYRPNLLGFMEALIRAMEFKKTKNTDFAAWIKEIDQADIGERARHLVEAQRANTSEAGGRSIQSMEDTMKQPMEGRQAFRSTSKDRA